MADAKSNPPIAAKHKRPKLAAALIITRTRANGQIETLLGRRSTGHVFMPSKYVFPGGRVDRGDGYAPLANEPRAEVRNILTRVLSEHRARAAAAAALRETAEETGLLIAKPGEIKRPRAQWRPFSQNGVKPDAGALDVIARAITPPGRPRRFDAWFFQVDLSAVHGSDEPTESSELEDLRWVTLEQAHKLDIPIVTRFVLTELEARFESPDRPVRCVRVTRSGPQVDEV